MLTTPATPATPATEPSDGPAALSSQEVVDLLMGDEATETPAATVPAADADDSSTEGEGEGEAPAAEATEATTTEATETDSATPQANVQTPKPGTPDKALQKLQQDLAAATRRIETLSAKLDKGEALTGQEKQQLQQSKRKLDAVREKVSSKDTDWYEPTKVGEVATDLTEALTETDTTVRALQQQVDELTNTMGAIRAEKKWTTFEQQYPKVKVQTVWEKAVDDAAAIIGDDDQTKLVRLASKMFHERASAAAKNLAAKGAPLKPGTKPPVTPGAAKVGVNPGLAPSTPVNDEQAQMRDYMSLVAD